MASSTARVAALLARKSSRSVATRSYHASALVQGGSTPPMPPFARIPPPTEPLAENNDAIWDDGVAPELALDFDMPHISSREALGTWMFGFGCFAVFYQALKLVYSADDNPAVSHDVMLVDKDHGNVGENRPVN